MISLRNLAEPVTLVRSPTLTKGISGVSVNDSRPDSRNCCGNLGNGARRLAGDRLGDGRDVLRRGAAAAADDVDQPGVGELAEQLRHEFRALVVVAEFVGQAGIRIGADEGVGEAADLGDMRAHFLAPSAQFRPMVTGLACRTAFQNAAGVWPDSRRPERSVMVPEIITGTSTPRSSQTSAMA